MSDVSDGTLVLVGHGSRAGEANREFLAFAEKLRQATGLAVEPGFVELAEPTLAEALDRAARLSAEVAVVPFILFAAGHVKLDLPLEIEAARRRHPGMRFAQAAPLGLHPRLLEIAGERLDAALDKLGETGAAERAVLLVGRGSSDPDANSEVAKLARLLSEGRGCMLVEAAYCGVTRPSVPEGLERVARLGARGVVVLPHLIFAGVLEARLRDNIAAFRRAFPGIEAVLADTLGGDPRLIEVVLERRGEALDGAVRMSCDLCKYKVRLPGFADERGGEKALLHAAHHTASK